MSSIVPIQMLTMTSREIADLTGKQHQHVKRDIEAMLSELKEDASSFGRIYLDGMNRQQTEFALDRELTETLLTGYSALLRRKVIARWHELEKAGQSFYEIPKTMAQALRLAADQQEKIEAQQLLIEGQKPAVEFVDRFVEAKSAKGLREVAKILGRKEREFIAQLAASGIIFKQGKSWLPKAEHQHSGYFEVKAGEASGHAFHQMRFTPAGIVWIAKRFLKAA